MELPCYRVRLPEGEREVDALELLGWLRMEKVRTTVQVAPAGRTIGGRFTRRPESRRARQCW